MHHEVELAVLIGSTLRQATEEHVLKGIAGYGVALDLTLRDLQAKMKKRDNPGRRPKASITPVRSPALSRPLSSTATRRIRR